MAVKRVTIELDDIPDTARHTSLPSSLGGKGKTLSADRKGTGTPEQQADYQLHETIIQKEDADFRPGVIGRTPSDLVFAFFDRSEFMATMLTFLSFAIFITKLHQVFDFMLPLLFSAILNSVWFGIRMIRYIKKWFH
jgi:hypothetical protein